MTGAQVRRSWRGLLVLSSVLVVLGWSGPAAAQTTCTASSLAITEISSSILGTNPDLVGLVADCTTLLGLKDELRGTAILNWAEAVAMDTWDSISVSETPPRVTSLFSSPPKS